MTTNTYEAGRLNLPFVGICTFGKYPYISDWDAIDADVAVLGAPYDMGCQWRGWGHGRYTTKPGLPARWRRRS